MSITIAATFKVGFDSVGLACIVRKLRSTCKVAMFLLGVWEHAPRKTLKIFPSEIEISSSSFD